jgi:NodT family efflux transporter outer membrane factor (OMF) lipoprotein
VDVADAYADFVRLTQDRDEALEAVRVRRDTLKLVAARRANGLETRGEYSQQNATVSTAQGLVDALDLQILQTRHQIAALVGAGPDRGLQIEAPARRTAYLRPYGLPSSLSLDLVGRRPDIVAARLRAEAARQRIKVARAGFYPNVDLAGSFLAFSVANQNPLKNSVSLAELGPAITLPIFTGGQTEGAYRSARADYDQAAALYDSTLAKALRDVADALAGQRALQTQIKDARDALTADEDAYAIAKLRYEGGLSPYLVVLTAESAVLQQRQTVVNLSVQSLTSDLALVRALGGGYVQAVASNSSH